MYKGYIFTYGVNYIIRVYITQLKLFSESRRTSIS